MNNYQKHLKQIAGLKKKPSLLIHVCCGVCSVYPLRYLAEFFDITVLFSNSNIYPYEEYLLRLDALYKNLETIDKEIKVVVSNYDNENYTKLLEPFRDEKEGGKRCYLCYSLRMKDAFEYANINHYDYVTTVMSISNRKNADYINEIGEKLNKVYTDVTYLYADFKKGDGITLNEKLNKELNLYHQNYCGCIYSLRNN